MENIALINRFEHIGIRVNANLKKAAREEATKDNLSLSEFVQRLLVAEMKRRNRAKVITVKYEVIE